MSRGFKMPRLFAVVGANYGDEGKGRAVDLLVRGALAPLVIRHNSSAQAGHTVARNGQRHVHSHFGSGTLGGAPTLLAHRFIVNPILFRQEYDELTALGVWPRTFLARSCRLTTPLDTLLNQLTELSRDCNAHGSCGIGFGETIGRHEHRPITFADWNDALKEPLRLHFLAELSARALRVAESLRPVVEAIQRDEFNWGSFDEAVSFVRDRVGLVSSIPRGFDTFVFEGAQGLLLHQDHPNFPHVTRSRTGLEDVVEFMAQNGLEQPLCPHYTSRSYLTRHGAGPLDGIGEIGPFDDPTNQPNAFQGTMRFASLDCADLVRRIESDLGNAPNVIDPTLIVSCCDQLAPSDHLSALWGRTTLRGYGPDAGDTEWTRAKLRA